MNYEEYVARIDAIINVLDEIERTRKIEYTNNIEFLQELKRKIIYREITEDVLEKINTNVIKDTVDNKVKITGEECSKAIEPANVSEKVEQVDLDAFGQDSGTNIDESNQSKKNIGYTNPKYEKHLDEFMEMARSRKLPQNYLKLVVSEKYASDIVTRNYEMWQVYAHKNKITLKTTEGMGKFNAFPINGEYYYIMPDNSLSYRENGIVQNAVLTYFDLPMDAVLEGRAFYPNVVRPAVADLKNGEFTLIEKGIIKFGIN